MEAEQLSDKTIYKDVTFNKNIIPNLTEKSNKIFENLKRRDFLIERQLRHFRFDFKISCNFGKLYFLPNIHKLLSDLPGRPKISTCGTPTEKESESLGSLLQLIMKKGLSYIKDSYKDSYKKVILLIKFGEWVLYRIMLFWLQLMLQRYTLASLKILD